MVSSAFQTQKCSKVVSKEVIDLRPGEKWGWWSEKKPNQRVRARITIDSAVNDLSVKILLDSDANISIMSMKVAKQLKLSHIIRPGRALTVPGLSDLKLTADLQGRVKITLGWSMVCRYTVWIGNHNGAVILYKERTSCFGYV